MKEDWLVGQVAVLGMPFQNWMIVTFALILVVATINIEERR